MENDWCLYVFVREDLSSMNHGKALAHSGHATSQAILSGMSKTGVSDDIREWLSQADDFGTQINISVPYNKWFSLLVEATSNNLHCGQVVDPTYPYIISKEMLELIDSKLHTHIPLDIGKGKVLCCRREVTAGWIFTRKSHPFVQSNIKQFKLAK